MRQVNRTPLAAALAVGLVAVVAAALVSPVSAAGHAVAIRDSSFGPKTITIRAGDRITWTNTGSNNHNVTFASFASTELHGSRARSTCTPSGRRARSATPARSTGSPARSS